MFRIIYKIAKAEVALLFYSPVAWLLLVVFAIQCAMNFTGNLEYIVKAQEQGYFSPGLTPGLFAGMNGLFVEMTRYLYFYIPLLTMGLISRELSSGSIKLLYSSPITNFQIIIGKYLSVMMYGFVLLGIMLVMTILCMFLVKDFGLTEVLTGFLGMYLLLCAYGAIGIFMSSLTSYQIVAAVGTLIVLMFLGMVGRWGQEIDFVRDVTYWFSINGRVNTFIHGMICSEDVLYFLIVIALFLSLTVIRLTAVRQKIPFSITFGKNMGVILLTCILGYFTSLPGLKVYYDATATKRNTLTEHSQEIVDKMKGGLTITTYINVLDDPWSARGSFIKFDEQRFEQYLRFKPEIKLKNVYYYDEVIGKKLSKEDQELTLRERFVKTCKSVGLDTNKFLRPEEIRKIIDLRPENNKFVRLVERESGEKIWLRLFNDMQRYPSEREITAAFKRLVMDLPVVGFVTGHEERSATRERDMDYSFFATEKTFRYALINQGFDTEIISLDKPVPDVINIIVIADPRRLFTEEENKNLDAYIARGGNLMILGEPYRRDMVNPLFARFGVEMIPGVLVKPDTLRQSSDVIASIPQKSLTEMSYDFEGMIYRRMVLATLNTGGLRQVENKGFKYVELFKSDTSGSWNEMETRDFVNDTVRLNPEIGEKEQSYATVVGLSRQIGDKEQKIILAADADCISNLGMGGHRGLRASNFTLVTGGFFWFSDGEVPIDMRRPRDTDDRFYAGITGEKVIKWTFMLIIPLLLAGFGIFTWLRRKGR